MGMHIRAVRETTSADRILNGSGVCIVPAVAPIARTGGSSRGQAEIGTLRVVEIACEGNLVHHPVDLDALVALIFHNLPL